MSDTNEIKLPDHPQSRIESYLSNIAGEEHPIPPHPMSRIEAYLAYIAEHGPGPGPSPAGTVKSVNSVEPDESGNVEVQASDIPVSQVSPDDPANIEEKFSEIEESLDSKYTLPESGIPATDLADGVIPEMEEATEVPITTSVTSASTDSEIPTAKAVHDAIPEVPSWAMQSTKPSYTASEISDNGTNVASEISAINGKISSQATSTNKLVSASEMGDAISSVEAKQLYATNAQGSFATKAALTSASVFYNADGTVATPTKNDVAYVLADESHSGKSAKYVIAEVSGSTVTWGFVITFSDSTFTQAQMDAINSNVTDAKRQGYDTHVANSDIHVTAEQKTSWSAKYQKPSSGIPASDLASGVLPTVYTEAEIAALWNEVMNA